MVSLEGLERQERYFHSNKDKILSEIRKRDCRYAVVHLDTASEKVKYFKLKKQVYNSFPILAPNSGLFFGTPPLLVDYEEETNSYLYQKEQLAKQIRDINRGLINLKNKRKELIHKLKT
ncbi:MAG: hypothetical protein ACOC3Z_01085 [Nanoarchaeota archaeon]